MLCTLSRCGRRCAARRACAVCGAHGAGQPGGEDTVCAVCTVLCVGVGVGVGVGAGVGVGVGVGVVMFRMNIGSVLVVRIINNFFGVVLIHFKEMTIVWLKSYNCSVIWLLNVIPL